MRAWSKTAVSAPIGSSCTAQYESLSHHATKDCVSSLMPATWRPAPITHAALGWNASLEAFRAARTILDLVEPGATVDVVVVDTVGVRVAVEVAVPVDVAADAAVVPNEPSVADAAARDSQAASAAADFTLLPETAVLEAQLDANAALPSPVTEPPWPASPRDALEGVADDVDAQVLPIFLEEATELFPRAGETLRAWRRDPEIAQHAAELRSGDVEGG